MVKDLREFVRARIAGRICGNLLSVICPMEGSVLRQFLKKKMRSSWIVSTSAYISNKSLTLMSKPPSMILSLILGSVAKLLRAARHVWSSGKLGLSVLMIASS